MNFPFMDDIEQLVLSISMMSRHLESLHIVMRGQLQKSSDSQVRDFVFLSFSTHCSSLSRHISKRQCQQEPRHHNGTHLINKKCSYPKSAKASMSLLDCLPYVFC